MGEILGCGTGREMGEWGDEVYVMKVGIDRISFYTPAYYLPLDTLAEVRGAEADKFHIGLGQDTMAVPAPDQDIVTLAANAGLPLVEAAGREGIGWVLFATESGVDQSKAAALPCRGLLGLPATCRCVELKEACYGGTAAVRLAEAIVRADPKERVLVLAADVARYDLGSPGEPTQGAGAVAMLVAAEPGILSLDAARGVHTEDIMDFWRPNYREEALAEGRYSTRMYLATLGEAYARYRAAGGTAARELDRLCFHMPFTKIARKGYSKLVKGDGGGEPSEEEMAGKLDAGTAYNRKTGNTYAACVWEGLVSLLDTDPADLGGKRVGFFSYGSGCMAEFFGGTVEKGYRGRLFAEAHRAMLEGRTALTYRQYEDIFQYGVPKDGGDHVFAPYRSGAFRLAGVSGHKRKYEAAEGR